MLNLRNRFGQVVRNDGLNHTSASAVNTDHGRDYDPDGDCDLRTAVGLPLQSVRLVRTGGAGRLRYYVALLMMYRKVVRKDTKGLDWPFKVFLDVGHCTGCCLRAVPCRQRRARNAAGGSVL